MVHKQLSTVFVLAIKLSSCIAIPPPSWHQWNNPATSWSQQRRSCKKPTSLDRCLIKASCHRSQENQVRRLNNFFWVESLKRNKTHLFKRVFCLGKAVFSSWQDTMHVTGTRGLESQSTAMFCTPCYAYQGRHTASSNTVSGNTEC